MRTDENNNPTAFTTDVAQTGQLVLGADYEPGTPFTDGTVIRYTAKLLGDPIAVTIKLMDTAGFYTHAGAPRWRYSDGPIGIPHKLWQSLTTDQKALLIGILYEHEGGTAMRHLFPEIWPA